MKRAVIEYFDSPFCLTKSSIFVKYTLLYKISSTFWFIMTIFAFLKNHAVT